MKRTWRFTLLVFLALLIPVEAIIVFSRLHSVKDVPVVRSAASKAAVDGTIDSDAVDRFVSETLRRSGIPGAAVAIVHGGRILHTAGYGRNADGSPVTPDSLMAVASVSKSFTAVAVMQLVEESRIELDAPVRQYLPEFTPADPRAGRITVRQLLNHSSGLTFESLPGTNVRGRSPMHQSVAERVAWLRGATLAAEPGTQATYDNFGYEVLARMVEQISGKSFAEYLRDRVFAPLGMNSSRSFTTTRDPVTVAPGHTIMFGIPVQWQMPPDLVVGAGGVVSSANDMARWLVFQSTGGRTVSGEQFLPAEAVAVMHTASTPGGNYGFGWRQSALDDGTPYVHHSGRIVTYAAHQALFPRTGMAYAFMCNGLDPIPAGGASLIAGLNAVVTGRTATPAGYSAAVIDHLIMICTLFVISVGVVGVTRSSIWAQRFAGRTLIRPILRCVPYAALVAAAVLLQRFTVPWAVWWETWPPFAISLLAVETAGASIVLFRTAQLIASQRGRR